MYAIKAHALTISRTIYKQHSSWKELARLTMNGCWSWLSIERIFFSDKMCSTCLNLITSVFRSIFTAKCCWVCVWRIFDGTKDYEVVDDDSRLELQITHLCCFVCGKPNSSKGTSAKSHTNVKVRDTSTSVQWLLIKKLRCC